MKTKTPFDRVLAHFGGNKAALARALGVSPPYISKMIRFRHVPVEQCRAIEAAVNGAVTAEELRPDIFAKPIKQAIS